MAEETTQEEAPKKSKTMLIVIIIVAVNLIIGGVVVVVMMGGKSDGGEKEKAPETAAVAGPTAGPGTLIPMDNFVVNVSSETGGKYLKTSIALEIKVENAADLFAKWEKLLRNEVLVYLSSLDVEDTRTAKQKRQMEEKIKSVLNERIGQDVVSGVYFTEFVTQ